MSLLDFADGITPDDMAEWNEAISQAVQGDNGESSDEKKARWNP